MNQDRVFRFIEAYPVDSIDMAIDVIEFTIKNGLNIAEVLRIIKMVSAQTHAEQAKEIVYRRRYREINKRINVAKRRNRLGKGKKRKRITECEQPKMAVIGKCPKCGGILRGEPLPACEVDKTGRSFYKECDNCEFFATIWKRSENKFEEVEGI